MGGTMPAILVLGLLLGAGDAKTDEELFPGTWNVSSLENGGQKETEEKVKQLSIVFREGGKAVVKTEQKETEVTWQLDATKKPRQISLTDGNKTLEGIYKLEGDTLTLCLAEVGKETRPTEFASPAGSRTLLIVLKR